MMWRRCARMGLCEVSVVTSVQEPPEPPVDHKHGQSFWDWAQRFIILVAIIYILHILGQHTDDWAVHHQHTDNWAVQHSRYWIYEVQIAPTADSTSALAEDKVGNRYLLVNVANDADFSALPTNEFLDLKCVLLGQKADVLLLADCEILNGEGE